MPVLKYRPYFTSSELQEIITALKTAPTPSKMPLIRYLEGFALKIDRGIIRESHTLEPSLADRMELNETHTEAVNSLQSKKYNSYRKHRDYPSSCTPIEIEQSMLYMYENDLMTSGEESDYELAQFQLKGI